MKISRHIWAWQRDWFERRGWTVDGGIWPSLRITRPMRLDDYIYGDQAKAFGLSALIENQTPVIGGIDSSPSSHWRSTVNFREEGEYGEGATMVVKS